MTMDTAYIDSKTNQATCVWNAPDLPTIEALFEQCNVTTESITSVEEYS